jgi:hypothetical protein
MTGVSFEQKENGKRETKVLEKSKGFDAKKVLYLFIQAHMYETTVLLKNTY